MPGMPRAAQSKAGRPLFIVQPVPTPHEFEIQLEYFDPAATELIYCTVCMSIE